MKQHNPENAPILSHFGTNKIYGTTTNQILSDLKKRPERESCKLDADGISATCSAYSGEITAGAIVFASKTLCASLNPALALTIAGGAGLANAICTFFVCRYVINRVNNQYKAANNITLLQNEKIQAQIMKK